MTIAMQKSEDQESKNHAIENILGHYKKVSNSQSFACACQIAQIQALWSHISLLNA